MSGLCEILPDSEDCNPVEVEVTSDSVESELPTTEEEVDE